MVNRVSVVPLKALSKAGKAYTYGVPEGLREAMRPGLLVRVPFRNRPATGIVVDTRGDTTVPRVVDVQAIEDAEPVLLPHQLELASWIAGEYAAPLADVLSTMLPPVFKRTTVRGRSSSPTPVWAAEITDLGREALIDAGALKRSPAQRRLLERAVRSEKPVAVADLLAGRRTVTAPLRALEAKGLIRLIPIPSDIPPPAVRRVDGARRLSTAQQQAVAAIVGALPESRAAGPRGNGLTMGIARPARRSGSKSPSRPGVFLLHGVTGSGKTEVYMAAIEEVLRRGFDALVMVPEISLTPQALQRFEARFPGLVASLHSRMAAGERRAEWQRLRTGQARIAIGPRSALFAPLRKPGVIVLDEEHDASYKQEESPRYHAREVAVRLGGLLSIPVVLGSATPDVASFYQARQKRYSLLRLPDRPVWDTAPEGDGRSPESRGAGPEVPSRPMPSVEIVDLRQELKAGNRSIFSRRLLECLEETVEARHQALLFLNRRGAATSVVCRDCGYVAVCKACDLPLTFHSANLALVCHRCDRRLPAPRVCPECGGDRIRYLGAGTQRVAEEVSRALPSARVLRWDRDVTSKRGAHEAIAAKFAAREADILVGTQMIAKGLDFPWVTLVGVVVADVGLNLPDFRAPERAFQLMTQVGGRAGRADLPSRVIIQAYNPDHYALRAARNHDYWSFYRQEMTFRLASGYPPFSRLVRFLLKGKDEVTVGRRAHELRDALVAAAAGHGGSYEVIGPAPAYMARVNDVFHWHLLMRGESIHTLLAVVPDDVIVDVDPVDLL